MGVDSWRFIDRGTCTCIRSTFSYAIIIYVDCHITQGVSTTIQITEMVFSCYKKQRILYLYMRGYKPPMISRSLESEGMVASWKGIARFLKRYHQTGSIFRQLGSSRPSKLTADVKKIVEDQLQLNRTASTGGKLLPNLQIATQLRMSGMSSRNTCGVRLNQRPRKS